MSMEPMIRDIESFGDCLKDLMDAHHWSLEIVTQAAGYKSRTSISRLLAGETEQKTCRATYRRLCDSGLLSEDDRRRLGKALENSETGVEQVRVQRILSNLIFGKRPEVPPAPPRYLELLDALAGAQSAEVLLVNCMNNVLLEPLRQVLEANPAVTARHYFAIGSSESRAAMALARLAYMAYLPNYTGLVDESAVGMATTFGTTDMVVASIRAADGTLTDSLTLITEGHTHVRTFTSTGERGLFVLFRDVLGDLADNYSPATCVCNAAAGPQQFVEMMCLWESCEHKTPMFHMQSDLCINLIDPSHVRAALEGGPLETVFANVPGSVLKRALNQFLTSQRNRFANITTSHQPKHICLSRASLEYFARTGRIGGHFYGMRPFSMAERSAILQMLLQLALHNRHFFLYFYLDAYEPKVEIDAWIGKGLSAFPIRRGPQVQNSFTNSVIFSPRLARTFQTYFQTEVKQHCVMSDVHGIAFLRDLIRGMQW